VVAGSVAMMINVTILPSRTVKELVRITSSGRLVLSNPPS
jgi:hypothetical protein